MLVLPPVRLLRPLADPPCDPHRNGLSTDPAVTRGSSAPEGGDLVAAVAVAGDRHLPEVEQDGCQTKFSSFRDSVGATACLK